MTQLVCLVLELTNKKMQKFTFLQIKIILERIEVNKNFISEDAKAAGWSIPYPPDTSIRQITLGKEAQFLRVFRGDSPYSGFLVRSKEIANIINDPQAIKTIWVLKICRLA